MKIEDAVTRFGDELRTELHRVERVVDSVPVARERLGDVDFHALRRHVDLAIAQGWAAGVEHASAEGGARAALLTLASEWYDSLQNAVTSQERAVAQVIYDAFTAAAARFVPVAVAPRYRFNPESEAARSFFGGDTGELPDVATSSSHDG